MLHVCTVKFDVTRNLKKNWFKRGQSLNKPTNLPSQHGKFRGKRPCMESIPRNQSTMVGLYLDANFFWISLL